MNDAEEKTLFLNVFKSIFIYDLNPNANPLIIKCTF